MNQSTSEKIMRQGVMADPCIYAAKPTGKVKRIKITNCKDPMLWYAEHIGEEYDVLADEGSTYRTREPAGYINFVLKEDAEPL